MTSWRGSQIGDEIELAYGKSLPANARETGVVGVFGSNGCIGSHSTALISGPGIVVGRKGSVGRVVYSHQDFWPIDTTYYVVNKNGHDWRFLYHLLSYVGLTGLNSHSAVPGLNREIAYSMPISLPEKTEQEWIASVLDTIERAVRHEGLAIEQSQVLKRAAMHTLFTRGLRGEAQKETEIGAMPESWEVKTILDTCDIWSGGTPRKSVAEYWRGSIPWVSGKDLKSSSLCDTIDHVTAEGIEAGSRLAPTGAVLLLVRGMGLANDLPVAVINRPMAFNQDVKALVPRCEYSGRFLRSAVYVGKERLLGRIVTSAHGTMTLNLNDVERFKLPCPSGRAEADGIIAILDAIDRKIDLHRRKRAVLEELFKALLHKLITREIQVGELDLSEAYGESTCLRK